VIVNLAFTKYRLFHDVALSMGWKTSQSKALDLKSDPWDMLWIDSGQGIDKIIRQMKAYQRINHFPGMAYIYRKDLLAKSIDKMKKLMMQIVTHHHHHHQASRIKTSTSTRNVISTNTNNQVFSLGEDSNHHQVVNKTQSKTYKTNQHIKMISKKEYDFTPMTWFIPKEWNEVIHYLRHTKNACVIMKPSTGAQVRLFCEMRISL
jgi:hypothetical protein